MGIVVLATKSESDFPSRTLPDWSNLMLFEIPILNNILIFFHFLFRLFILFLFSFTKDRSGFYIFFGQSKETWK